MDRDGRVNSLINQRYLIVRPLGEGGMGFVYLARDTALGDRTLALKILRPEVLDSLAVERFKEEFRSMARLRHPNLAEVYDFETVAGSGERFLTMEHIDGRDLGVFRWPALREGFDDLAVQCLRALDYIHARGLLHNDIKPHNIMVSPPFQVKILDFGLAQRRADSRSPGLSGTVHYIAPERLKGEGPDGRSDLYSLGVVLYELVTGSLPYQGEDVGQVITAILQGRLRPPREINPEIPARLEAFVLALLAHDRAGRPASSSAALDLLNRGLARPLSLDTPETHASFTGSGKFVGRDAELAGLLELATAGAADPGRDDGRPRLVLVGGPSGIGKSRLLRELRHRLQLAGVRCLTGRCYEDGAVPFQVFVEALRQVPKDPALPDDLRASLEQILPAETRAGQPAATQVSEAGTEGALASTGGGPATRGQARGDKATFLAGLAASLEHLSKGSPGVVFLEDLHWSDVPGIDLLEQLIRRPTRTHWTLLGSLREDEAEATPTGALLKRFEDDPRLRRISLKPLDPNQVAELVGSMVPFQERPARLARLLAERTEGNPLYIEELMRSLAEQGTVRRSGGGWIAESRSLDTLRLPPSLASMVARRLAALPPVEREAAEVLAVFNRPVPITLLARALGSSETAAASVASLARLRLAVLDTERAGPPVVDLAHSRIREAIYRAMTEDRRRTLHGAVGRAIESAHPEATEAVVEELAHHFMQAGDRARAADYALRAARKAEALFDFKQVDHYLVHALDLLPAGDARRLETLKGIATGRCEDLVDFEGGLRFARKLQEEAHRAGNRVYEAGALRLQGWAMSYLENSKGALDAARRGLALARASSQPDEIVWCLNTLGTIHARLGEHVAALACFEESSSIAEPLGNLEAALAAQNNAALCHLGLGEAEVGRQTLERMLATAKDHGMTYHYQRYPTNLGIARQEAGDLVGAIETYEEAIAWAREHSNLEMIGLLLSGLAQVYMQRGLFDRALRAAEEERALWQRLRAPASQIMPLDFMGVVYRETGRADLAQERHEEGLEIARRHGARMQEGHLLASLATDRLDAGALEPAETLAREALAIGREIAHSRVTCFALSVLALIAARRGDRRGVALASRHLARLDARPLRYYDRLLLNLAMGRCALALGKAADAEREARAGLAAADRGGYREFQWKLLTLLGDALRAKGLPDEAATAYNAAHVVTRQVAAQIEEPEMRQDYEQDPRREEVAERAADLTLPAPASQAGPAAQPSLAAATDAPVKMLTTIYEITQIINSILDLKELLNKVMDLAIEIVRAERGLIFLYRGETDEMEMVVARNMERQTIKDATEYSRSVLKEVGRGRAILSHDAVTDARFKEFRSVSMYQIRSLLCVPLRIKERVIGTVYVDTRKPGVVFGEEDLRFLEAFANQASVAIENARLYDQVRQENQYLKQAVQERYGYESIVGRSPKMREVFTILTRVAHSNLPVMIRGESGTGKELVARAIHHNSARRDRKFFSENCAALPETLLESELFGHMRGSFTGADATRRGLFELADGGTLFLDEIGDMSMSMQSKLLRALQDGEVRPVGSETTHHVDVRVVSATNRDLEAMVKARTFREDLYFRLKVITVRIPALRDRRDDVPLLVDHFLGKIARENNGTKLRVDPALMALLTRYDWPGNVRELENQVYRLALFASGDTLALRDAKNDVEFYDKVTVPGTRGVETSVTRTEVEQALSRAKGNRVEAARLLGISRATMFRKLKLFELDEKPARHEARRPHHEE